MVVPFPETTKLTVTVSLTLYIDVIGDPEAAAEEIQEELEGEMEKLTNLRTWDENLTTSIPHMDYGYKVEIT